MDTGSIRSPDPLPLPLPHERRAARIVLRHTMRALKAVHSARRSRMQRIADTLSRWAASTPFFFFHVGWFTLWVAWNVGALGLEPFDPFPFGLLTMVVSLEAIFLSVFVLMTQGREAGVAELREELMLQVNMRMEAEVTKTLQLVTGLYTRLGQTIAEDADLQEMLQPLDTEEIERELAAQLEQALHGKRWRGRSSRS